MASGSEPPHIQRILNHLRGLCCGVSLCGAGAGGFAVLVAQRDVTRRHLQQSVDELNRVLGAEEEEKLGTAEEEEENGGSDDEEGEGKLSEEETKPASTSCGNKLTLHDVTVDLLGISTTTLPATNSQLLTSYLLN